MSTQSIHIFNNLKIVQLIITNYTWSIFCGKHNYEFVSLCQSLNLEVIKLYMKFSHSTLQKNYQKKPNIYISSWS